MGFEAIASWRWGPGLQGAAAHRCGSRGRFPAQLGLTEPTDLHLIREFAASLFASLLLLSFRLASTLLFENPMPWTHEVGQKSSELQEFFLPLWWGLARGRGAGEEAFLECMLSTDTLACLPRHTIFFLSSLVKEVAVFALNRESAPGLLGWEVKLTQPSWPV